MPQLLLLDYANPFQNNSLVSGVGSLSSQISGFTQKEDQGQTESKIDITWLKHAERAFFHNEKSQIRRQK